MQSLIFGSDLDDCIIHTAREIVKELGYESPEVLKSIGRFSLSESLGVKKEEVDRAVDNVLSRTDLKFLDSFLANLKDLLKITGQIKVITSRRKHLTEAQQVLNRELDLDEYVLYGCERYENGIPKKADVIIDAGINVFVEDRFATAIDIVQKTGCYVLLMNKPWNSRLTQHERLVRVNNWFEILDFLNRGW